jgi:hypothetical protein
MKGLVWPQNGYDRTAIDLDGNGYVRTKADAD